MKLPAKVKYAIALTFVIWLVGGIVYHYLEKWDYIDSFYFAATTLTTVGYGDHSPQTVYGKIFTIFYVFTGIAIVLYTLTLIGGYYFEERFETRVLKHTTKHAKNMHRRVGNFFERKDKK